MKKIKLWFKKVRYFIAGLNPLGGSHSYVEERVRSFLAGGNLYDVTSHYSATSPFEINAPFGKEIKKNLDKDAVVELLPFACYEGYDEVGLYIVSIKNGALKIYYDFRKSSGAPTTYKHEVTIEQAA